MVMSSMKNQMPGCSTQGAAKAIHLHKQTGHESSNSSSAEQSVTGFVTMKAHGLMR